MKLDTPKLSIFLDKRYAKKDGKFPVKLRITYKREAKYYPTEFNMTEDEFIRQRDSDTLRANKIIGTKEYAQLAKINSLLNNYLADAQKVIDRVC
jgi:hypothetical protein